MCQTASEFRPAVGQVSSADARQHIEAAVHAEPLEEEVPPAAEAPATFTEEDKPKLVVPTGKTCAKMWEPKSWQEWNPMDWCYGDCVYGDERLSDKPYKRTSFQEMVIPWLLREELEYDMYPGENYEADHGESKLWEHQPDLELLLEQLEAAEQKQSRASVHAQRASFAVNRFAIHPVIVMVISIAFGA